MDASSFFRPLKPYLDAFVECHGVRRLALFEQGLTPSAEIWGPIRVFTGYAKISEKIDGFHQNWPDCRLVVTSGIVCFNNAGHFAMAIVSPGGSILASGHSVAELAADGRIDRVLAFWGPQPAIPDDWPARLSLSIMRGRTRDSSISTSDQRAKSERGARKFDPGSANALPLNSGCLTDLHFRLNRWQTKEDYMLKHLTCAVVLALAISGCTHLPASVTAEVKVASGIDGVPGVDTIENAAPGLVEFGNAPLLAQAQRPSGEGYLCSAKSFAITQPVRVYRLIDTAQPCSKLGGI